MAIHHGYAVGDPFGDPNGFTRHTQAWEVDNFNKWMRTQPWWQQIKGSAGGFGDAQKQQLLAALRAQGINVPDGIHVDDAGNFNQSRTTGDWVKYGALAGAGVAAAFGVPAIAGMFGESAASAAPAIEAAGMGSGGALGTAGGTMAAVAPHAASLFGIPAGAVFQGGTQLFGNLFGAWMQGHAADQAAQAESAAARYAADLQSQASIRAERFQREQAENAYQNSEVARHGNYDIYAAGQRRLGFLGEEVGLPAREIPGYVPGVDPGYTGGPGGSGTVGAATGGGAPLPGGSINDAAAKFNALFPGDTLTPEMLAAKRSELEALGFKLNPNASGKITDLTYGGYNIDPIQGAGSGLNKKQWLVSTIGAGGGAPVAPVAPVSSSGAAVPFLAGVKVAPSIGYLGSYA